ncbi:MAG: squalene synthase HpnD [Rhodospirillales bacterium CG15_BIG_FIL_POST_REV_8_21_14_020_66_15]|nr:MAG: squalene synthase HpnD [Rhodospirillales bacterium CG15_BIG_FIL_POST_REV_8_21_14_020_66_15]
MDNLVTRSEAEVGRARARVEEIVRASGTTFFWAMRFLPGEKRRAMFAVYAFCRIVDDIADDPNPLDEKRRDLARWRAEIRGLYSGRPNHPVAVALAEPIAHFRLAEADFQAVIDGMETDAAATLRLKTRDDLLQYCDRVACAVGRLSCRIFGLEVAVGDRLSAALGLALQLTNILRDIAEDAARDRLYLPEDLLSAHGIAAREPLDVMADPNLPAAAAEIATLAGDKFAEARALLARCEADRVKPATMMMEAYERIFHRMERRGWHRVLEPAGLTKAEKLWVAVRYGIL